MMIEVEPYKKMWKNAISLIDLHILHALREGQSLTTMDRYLSTKGIKITRTQVEKRVEELKSKRVILETSTVITNPLSLFDYLFLTFVKIHLPVVRGLIDWGRAFNDVMDLNKKYELLSMVFTVEGTGDYDLALFIYTNSIDQYYAFIADLTGLGWVEKVDGKRVHAAEKAGFFFNPVLLPAMEDYQKALIYYKKRLAELSAEEQ